MPVHALAQELLSSRCCAPTSSLIRDQPGAVRAHGVDVGRSRRAQQVAAGTDHVHHDLVDHAADDFVDGATRRQLRDSAAWTASYWRANSAHLAQVVERDQPGAQAVVDVVVVVGDLVGEVGDLRFERRLRVRSRKRSPSSPSSRALRAEQCLRMPSRHSKVRLRPGNPA